MDPLWLLLVGLVIVLCGILLLRLHPFLALILAALTVAALTPPEALGHYAIQKQLSPDAAAELLKRSPAERVAREFGNLAGQLGIIIAMAAIIGRCLLDSGAAQRIVRSLLRALGEPRAPVALTGSSFILGIPVFFDTVFFLMIPLGKAMALRTGRNYALYVMAIIAGATMTHSLVPPTPGPLQVAAVLGVDLGLLMLAGLIVGVFSSAAGLLYAFWSNRYWPIPLRDAPDSTAAPEDAATLPPLWLALLPILLPLLLIGGNAALARFPAQFPLSAPVRSAFAALGNQNVALILSAGLALLTLAWQKRGARAEIPPAVQSALMDAGLIILITSAGGAFGNILQQTNIGPRIQGLATDWQIAILPLAFALTTLIRTAQGSATVAMMVTAGMLAGMPTPGVHPLYIALAIGCGSKPFPWMNDSGFWVIGRMSALTVPETFRLFSFMITVMAIVGLLITMLLARLLPLV